MFELIVAWKNQRTKKWIPIGKLRQEDNKYIFFYTN